MNVHALLAALLLLCAPLLAAQTFYVSPQGDDRQDGRGPEPARALRTL
ncbi:MAG: hypothetical protein HYU66_27935 [Armatimonadetes bacterium]|nr:hypothetical protein [Armatimonadota bacterium]